MPLRRTVMTIVSIGALAAVLAVSGMAEATPLPPNSTDVSITNVGAFTGTVVNDTGPITYNLLGATGTLREWVVSDATTALCVGC